MANLCLIGQRPVYQQFTVDDGLPSNTIYKVEQDSKGYIWCATGTGATRFNGTDFENFDGSDGLGDVFGLSIDSKDRVWFWNNNTYFSYYWKGKIHHTDTIPYLNRKLASIPNAMLVDNDKLTIVTDSIDLVELDIEDLRPTKIIPVEEHKIGRSYVYPYLFKYLGFPPKHFINTSYCSEKLSFKLKRRIMHAGVFKTNSNNLWVVIANDLGLHLVEEIDSCLQNKKSILKDKKLNSVFEDRTGNLWVASQTEGLFLLPYTEVLSYDVKEGLSSNSLYSIANDSEGNIYVGNDIARIDRINETKKEIVSTQTSPKKGKVNDLEVSNNNSVWAASEDGVPVIYNDKQFNTGESNRRNRPDKVIFRQNDSTYWLGSANYVYKCYFDSITQSVNFNILNKVTDKRKFYALYAVGDTLWHGTARGLYKYIFTETDTFDYYYGENDKLLSIGIRDLEMYNNQLWIATANNGVLVFENDSVIAHIHKKTHPLSSNSCTEIFIDSIRNCIWVAGKNGLTQIVNQDNLDSLKFDIFNIHDGLIGNEATDMTVDPEGVVWVSTKSGLTRFKPEEMNKSNDPKIFINNVKIWDKDTTLHENYKLTSQQNDIGIDFESIYFNSPTQYKYKLFGRDEDWTITKNKSVRYSQLPAGDYTFEVFAINEEYKTSKQSAKISFNVALPFWKSKWFIALCLVTFCLLTYLIAKYRINQVKREGQLAELSLRGIRSQMNAHFLFNALNSIQSYILKSDAKTAYQFLTKLSKLIRQTLYHSNQKNILLQDEINLLKNYIDLEKLRLEDAFDYQFIVDPELENKNIKIQPLILQPYIENSIRWGLKDIDKSGLISIYVNEVKNDSLEFIIQDNGIGRKKAGEIKSKYFEDHKSMGTEINTQRMRLLSDIQKREFKVQIEDLYDKNQQATGTLVRVTMPIET